jgi:hypothetical protein
MSYPESVRICTLFANASKSGGTYYSGKLGGDEPVVIQPGQRVTLVKSTKLASNGAEIWSLLVDPLGSEDHRRVHDSRRDVDLDNHRGRQAYSHMAPRDEIPF